MTLASSDIFGEYALQLLVVHKITLDARILKSNKGKQRMHGVHERTVYTMYELLLLGVVRFLASHRYVGFELLFELFHHRQT